MKPMTQDIICECNCDLDIQCEDDVCKKNECESEECFSTCEQESEDYTICCGENCCDTTYDGFAC